MSSKMKQGKEKSLLPLTDDEARLSVALPPATYDELVIFAKQYGLKKAKVQLEKGQDPTQVEINFRIFPKSINVRNEMTEEMAEMQDQMEVTEETPVEAEPMEQMSTQQYIVQPGDTLFFIAKRFNITLDALKNANPQIENPELIFPGQMVMIPTQSLPPVPPNVFKYIVQPGDTLFFIARRFNVSLETLKLANPQITNPGLIFPGQIVFVPVVQMPPMPPGARQYIVQLGDTLDMISDRFGVTVDEILNINPQITNKDLIFPGQMIFIPSMMDGDRCHHDDDHKEKHHKDKHHDKDKHHHKDKEHHDDKYDHYTQKSNEDYGSEEDYNDNMKSDHYGKYNDKSDDNEKSDHDEHKKHEEHEEKHKEKHEEKCEEKDAEKHEEKHEEKCEEKMKPFECEDEEEYKPGYEKYEHHEKAEECEKPKKEEKQEECEPKKEECKPEAPKEEYKLEECETLNYFMYVVQTSDTLFEIAKKFRIELQELKEANPCITDPNKIYPGQLIKIPAKKYKKPLMTIKYVAQKGDTLLMIAEKFAIALALLAVANPQVTDQNMIFAGQVINIPVTKMPPVDMIYFKYIVQSGDTLYVISQKFGIKFESMLKINPGIMNPNNINPGLIVFIPTNKMMYKPAGTTEYAVQSGDTLFFIARRFNFLLADLIAANPQVKNPDLIFPGQIINIPPCEKKNECMENVPPKG